MSDLIINPDQQSGTYKGRKIVAVDSVRCQQCIFDAECSGLKDRKQCVSSQRKDGRSIIWQWSDTTPPDTALLDWVLLCCSITQFWRKDGSNIGGDGVRLNTRGDIRNAMEVGR